MIGAGGVKAGCVGARLGVEFGVATSTCMPAQGWSANLVACEEGRVDLEAADYTGEA
jgi:hypothetical protein